MKNHLIKIVVVTVLFTAVLIFLNVEVFKVVTSSMSPAIKTGEYVFVHSYSTNDYKVGDIIAFKKDSKRKKIIFVKRIVGVPGDVISTSNDSLFVNNKGYPHDSIFYTTFSNQNHSSEAYLKFLIRYSDLNVPVDIIPYKTENKAKIIIPEEYFFLIGDNHYESMDSRFWGFIHKRDIIGKVIATI